MFQNTTCLDLTADGLARLMAFKIEGDVTETLNVLRSLPGQTKIYFEIQFVMHFGKMAKIFAVMMKWYNERSKRGDRQLKDQVRKFFTALRADLKVFETFYNSKIVGQNFIFEDDVKSKLHHVASLGVKLDMSHIPATLRGIRTFIDNLVTEWSKDASDVARLINSWIVPGWELQKDQLLENEDLVKQMVDNPNYGRCGKACALLKEWRSCAKAINADGNGLCFSVQDGLCNFGAY